jgi:CheY-like chemotaxis protein
VLIVDGSARIRARLAERLAGEAAEIVEADSITASLAAVAFAAPDAILLDVHLDAGMGVTGLARLREAAPVAIIVALTNEANDIHERECVRHGADFFFDKSKDFDRAVELVIATYVKRLRMTPTS